MVCRPRKWLEYIDCISKPVFTCNVCGRRIRHPYDSPKHVSELFQRHRVIGAGFREKERCPVCNSIDRLRFTIEVLQRYTDIFVKPCQVLEIGPIEAMRRALSRNSGCKYITGDIISGRADLVLDITDLAIQDNCFDYVLCNHVLEHVEEVHKAMEELIRITKNGGLIELSMPIDIDLAYTYEAERSLSIQERLKLYGQENHVRLYGLDVAGRLREYGLEVVEVVADGTWQEEIDKYKLIWGDRNFLCTVSK